MPTLNSILNNVFGSSNERKLKKFNNRPDHAFITGGRNLLVIWMTNYLLIAGCFVSILVSLQLSRLHGTTFLSKIGYFLCYVPAFIPKWNHQKDESLQNSIKSGSFTDVWKNKFFISVIPMGFFNYGGLMAIQTLISVAIIQQKLTLV